MYSNQGHRKHLILFKALQSLCISARVTFLIHAKTTMDDTTSYRSGWCTCGTSYFSLEIRSILDLSASNWGGTTTTKQALQDWGGVRGGGIRTTGWFVCWHLTAHRSVWAGAEWAVAQGKAWYRFSEPAYLTPSSFLSFLWADSPRVLQVCWLYQYNILHLEFAYQCDMAALSIVPRHHHRCMNCLGGTSRVDKTE